ncbi:MAG: hypothetical protein IKZ41_09140, partial [Clostridia bacterium]|nr:hypothetical protein [Clostridia bacterium]
RPVLYGPCPAREQVREDKKANDLHDSKSARLAAQTTEKSKPTGKGERIATSQVAGPAPRNDTVYAACSHFVSFSLFVRAPPARLRRARKRVQQDPVFFEKILLTNRLLCYIIILVYLCGCFHTPKETE